MTETKKKKKQQVARRALNVNSAEFEADLRKCKAAGHAVLVIEFERGYTVEAVPWSPEAAS